MTHNTNGDTIVTQSNTTGYTVKITTQQIEPLLNEYKPMLDKYASEHGVKWDVTLTKSGADQIEIKFVRTILDAETTTDIKIVLYDELLLPSTQGRAQGFFIQQANRFQPGPDWGKMSAYVYEIRDQSPSLGDYHDVIMQNVWQHTGCEELYWTLNEWDQQ